MTLAALAAHLGVHYSTAHAMAQRGDVPAINVGQPGKRKQWRFRLSDVDVHLSATSERRDPWAQSPQARTARFREARKRIREGRASATDQWTVDTYLRTNGRAG